MELLVLEVMLFFDCFNCFLIDLLWLGGFNLIVGKIKLVFFILLWFWFNLFCECWFLLFGLLKLIVLILFVFLMKFCMLFIILSLFLYLVVFVLFDEKLKEVIDEKFLNNLFFGFF